MNLRELSDEMVGVPEEQGDYEVVVLDEGVSEEMVSVSHLQWDHVNRQLIVVVKV